MQDLIQEWKLSGQDKITCGGGIFGWVTWCWARKPPIPVVPWFTDGQKRKKKSCNFSNTHAYLISIAVFLQKVEAAAVWDMIQDFIQLPASQHPYNVDCAWCRCIFLTSREISLFSLWSLHPSKTAPGDISMNNTFYWLIHSKNRIYTFTVPFIEQLLYQCANVFR